MSKFDFVLSNGSNEPVTIAIFVNPCRVTQASQIFYPAMFPTPWKAVPLPAYTASSVPPSSSEIRTFTPEVRALVGGSSFNNTLVASSSALTAKGHNYFEANSTSNGAVVLSAFLPPTPDSTPGDWISITNKTEAPQFLGVADSGGVPYFGVNRKPEVTTRFNISFQFAVAVRVESTNGARDAIYPSITFMADDVKVDSVEIGFDGQNLTVGGVPFAVLPSAQGLTWTD